MDRRRFLRQAVQVVTLPLALDGLPVRVFGDTTVLAGSSAADANDRVLVLIHLAGGNDGINTVIPLDQYQLYQNVRNLIAIPEMRILRLTETTGLHPAAVGLKNLFEEGRATVIQGVSYPNPNLSHFRATDIWMTASGFDKVLNTGWAGRYLDSEFPDYPVGFPNVEMPDPPAIQIGAVVSTAFQGPGHSMGAAIQDPDSFYEMVLGSSSESQDVPLVNAAGKELSYIRTVAMQSQSYAEGIKRAADRAQNQSTLYPAAGRNSLADQLKIVARLIGGRLRTRIYMVSLGGFDTHANQVVAGDTVVGNHATLLDRLSTAVSAFQDDLDLLGSGDRVATMIFSEFGRRVAGNGSIGTDHGTAQPVFLLGNSVRGGIVGANPSLTDLSAGNLKIQFDYRAIYASTLVQWLGKSSIDTDALLLGSFPPLDLFAL